MTRLKFGPLALPALVIAGILAAVAMPAVALDDEAAANRLVVEAALLVESARDAVEPARRLKLLRRAHDNLKGVVERHSGSGLAVALATGQGIGTLSLRAVAEAHALAEGEACLAAPTSDCLLALSVWIARGLAETGDRDYALRGIVDLLTAAGLFDGAVETAKAIDDENDRTWRIIAVLRAQGDAGDAAGAERTLREALAAAGPDAVMGDSRAMSAIAKVQTALGDAAGALATARRIDDIFWRSEAMGLIATAQAAAGDATGAEATLAEALEMALATEADDRPGVTLPVAEARAAIGDVDGAIALARSLPEPHQRINTLVAIAEAEIEEGDPARARAVLVALVEEADSRADDEDRDGTLADAVYKLVAADDPVRALSAARAIRADGKRIKLVAFVTGALARAGDAAGAAKALSGMSEVAGAIADVGARVDAVLLGAVGQAVRDPETEVPNWLSGFTPLGIDVPIRECGIFPNQTRPTTVTRSTRQQCTMRRKITHRQKNTGSMLTPC